MGLSQVAGALLVESVSCVFCRLLECLKFSIHGVYLWASLKEKLGRNYVFRQVVSVRPGAFGVADFEF